MSEFTHVQVFKRSIGKQCMHCGRSAVVRAYLRTKKPKGNAYFKMPVRYCREHAIERGAISEAD